MKSRTKLLLRVVTTCLFLGYLCFRVDWRLIMVALQTIDLWMYLLSTAIAIATSILLGVKYLLLVRKSAIKRSLMSLVKINFISRFYAVFLPAVVGPEAIRWYKVTGNKDDRAYFFAAIIFERLSYVLTGLLFCILPFVIATDRPGIELLRNYILPAASIAFILVAGTVSVFISAYVRNTIGSIFNRIPQYNFVRRFVQSLSLNRLTFPLFIYIFGLSMIWQLCYLGRFYFLFQATAVHLMFVDIAWMCSIVLLLQILPVTVAGLGIREGALAFLVSFFNLPSENGVMIGILFFSQMLILSAIGGILELTD